MGNRYFRVAFTVGLCMATLGGTTILIGDTDNIKGLIFSVAFLSVMLPFAIWGIVNLIKGESDNG